jgi:hypothetical protein
VVAQRTEKSEGLPHAGGKVMTRVEVVPTFLKADLNFELEEGFAITFKRFQDVCIKRGGLAPVFEFVMEQYDNKLQIFAWQRIADTDCVCDFLLIVEGQALEELLTLEEAFQILNVENELAKLARTLLRLLLTRDCELLVIKS